MLYQWRNLPEIVRLGTLQRVVGRKEHAAWFQAMRGSPDHWLYIIERGGEPIGQIRFDLKSPRRASVSVYLEPGRTGHGYGTTAIRIGCQALFATGRVDAILADVLTGNRRSARAFRKAGFETGEAARGKRDGRRLILRRPGPVPHNKVEGRPSEAAAAARIVRSGAWTTGDEVRRFEAQLERYFRVEHAICVGSGLGAIRLALIAAGVGPGDRVVTPAYSCVALANAILALRATPVAVDVDEIDWNLDPGATENAVRKTRPRAIIAVNSFGSPVATSRLRRLGAPVIEDSSHGPGAPGRRRRGHPRPDAEILSLYSTKLLGAGMGGAVLTDSGEFARAVREWAQYDDKPADARRLNERMTDVSAAVAGERLRRLKSDLAARLVLARRYRRLLSGLETAGLCRLPREHPERAWYRYAIESRVAPAGKLVTELARYGIGAAQPVSPWAARPARFPNARRAHASVVSLPLYPGLGGRDQERVVDALIAVLTGHGSAG
jgi:dTDP-4-amino-4,6-dideoxygalactose transaminase/RimJ/RimL family protein N-acetyltransferase